MIRLVRKEDQEQVDFYVVDAHHHLGKEKEIKNLNPSGPDGSYYFLRAVLFGNQWKDGLVKELEDNTDEYAYTTAGQDHKPIVTQAIMAKLIEGDPPFAGIDATSIFDNTTVADKIVAFPMHDEYREKDVQYYVDKGVETPMYAFSNDKVSKITHRYPHSLRYFPYGRIYPHASEACTEVRRAITQLGMTGFKLHPKSDAWEIVCQELVDVLKVTSLYGAPTIYHTSFLSEVVQLHEIIRMTVSQIIEESELKNATNWDAEDPVLNLGKDDKKKLIELRQRLMGLKVIIGHCGWHSSPEEFRMFTNPHLFGEISGIKGQVVLNFFNAAEKYFDPNYFHDETIPTIEAPEGLVRAVYGNIGLGPIHTRWSNKVMFGSDYPFLDQNQSIDVLRTLMMVDFPGTETDIENFLGTTALRVNPPHFASPPVMRNLIPPETPAMLSLGFDELRDHVVQALLTGASEREGEEKVASLFIDPLIDAFPVERVRTEDTVLTLVEKGGNTRVFRLTPAFKEVDGEKALLGLAKWLTVEDIRKIGDRTMPLSVAAEGTLFDTISDADMDEEPEDFMSV